MLSDRCLKWNRIQKTFYGSVKAKVNMSYRTLTLSLCLRCSLSSLACIQFYLKVSMYKDNVLLLMAKRLSTIDQKENVYHKKYGDFLNLKLKWFEFTTIHLLQWVEVSSFVVC